MGRRTDGPREAFSSELVGPRHRLRERLLMNAFLDADPGPRVVNIGAGQGSFSLALERRGFAVTSVDLDPTATARLCERVKGPVVRADARTLPFSDGSFDGVVLGEVLEHVREDHAALREVVRVLRPGGVVAISVPANPELFGPSDRWAGHVRRYTRSGLLQVVEAASLTVETCLAWGFPCSTLYHRYVYEPRLARVGLRPPGRHERLASRLLAGMLNLDRLFLGVERGALGYLLSARAPASSAASRGLTPGAA